MRFIGIIPARYASSRFPGKPLVNINGKSMIQRVYEQVKKSVKLADVVIATDDKKIEEHIQHWGGKVMMTSSAHQSGTDRCAEVIKIMQARGATTSDVIINIQGDEPFIQPEQIDLLCSCFDKENVQIATLVKRIHSTEELLNTNTPKVIFNSDKKAIYFSRSPLPHYRGQEHQNWLAHHPYYKHIGIYAYKMEILKEITQLQPSPLEIAESLEQLRWLENGYPIHVAITDLESIAVDIPEDLEKLRII